MLDIHDNNMIYCKDIIKPITALDRRRVILPYVRGFFPTSKYLSVILLLLCELVYFVTLTEIIPNNTSVIIPLTGSLEGG